MAKAFSSQWKSSANPVKQRKYRFNAPLHVKGKFLHVHLSSDLREKHGVRQIRVKKGDKVKILSGQFKGRETKVDRVDVVRTRLYLNGIEMEKKSGGKVAYPIDPSNVMIVDLIDVKSRFAIQKNNKKNEESQ